MTLTLRELLAIPQITNKVLAGSAGLDRPVVWAHACEMPAPWDWVGEGELLMSIGHCVPVDESGQAHFVRQLAEAGLCGVALGDYAPMPRLSQAMLDTADDLGFPVLLTAHDTPLFRCRACRGDRQSALGTPAALAALAPERRGGQPRPERK
ncbi:hypothetical protein CLM62_36620 [Streptomyces sp. SA15]|uniref:PucR family transcriptional regulator ligand-binding domain-containing protein n=1 Tax=Streptomyces sp. SA15 TaxID=934019 RepID=UPI000BAF039E|nr:PucR family transcriptional regulator ligand-binding domain-containing protein [Streptomyces sp. SA15]PAZ11263.1 hypothetical protein CLM62_36620 [Streptomyces sp. SA15]